MTNHLYLEDESGNIRFTHKGINELSPYFEKAGIDIQSIRTVEQYQQAREAASPYFEEWLEDRTSEWPVTDEYELLRTAVLGNSEAVEKALHRFSVKQTLKVIH